jgi:hypothetical protein
VLTQQVWYTHPAFSIALGGVLPFGAVCIELFFIMSAMWLHQVLYEPPNIYFLALDSPFSVATVHFAYSRPVA